MSNALVIDRYEIHGELSRSDTSVVYLGRQPGLDRMVVIKALTSSDPDTYEFLVQEASVLAQLQHPHIISVYDIGKDSLGRTCSRGSKQCDSSGCLNHFGRMKRR